METLFTTCALLAGLLVLQRKETDASVFDELLLRYAGSGWSGSVLVARGEEPVLAGGYGFADFEAERANDETTPFELGSVTQIFTAAAVLRLAQENRLALDETIGVHLSAVPMHSREITLRQLLSHTAGIPGSNVNGRNGHLDGRSLTEIVVACLGAGPLTKPGTRVEFWDGGYTLLEGVIERVSGRATTEYLRETLLTPAGMQASSFSGERGMGGLVTNAQDLFGFDRALATHALLDEAHQSVLFTPARDEQALGWVVGRAADGSLRQSASARVRGHACEFRRLPERDACIAVLSRTVPGSADLSPREIADNLECLLLGRPLASTIPKRPLVSEEELAACVGVYVGAPGRLIVRHAPGILQVGIEGEQLLALLGANEKLHWPADMGALSRRAAEIVEGIAQGNTQTLRTHMAKRIPAVWPDTMRRYIWPAFLALHGEFRGVRPIGAVARGQLVEVLLALEHEQGPARALASFGPSGLERLDWEGPLFPATARLDPLRDGVFRLLLGDSAQKLEFARPRGEAASGERMESVRIGKETLRRN